MRSEPLVAPITRCVPSAPNMAAPVVTADSLTKSRRERSRAEVVFMGNCFFAVQKFFGERPRDVRMKGSPPQAVNARHEKKALRPFRGAGRLKSNHNR